MKKKLLLINPKDEEADYSERLYPPLSLLTIAGITPDEEWDIKIVDQRLEDIDFQEPADLVGITIMTYTAKYAYDIAEAFRKNGTKVIIGGIHAFALPDEVLKYSDSVVIGEAEDVWPQVLEDVKNNQLKKKYQGNSIDLNATRIIPKVDLINNDHYKVGVIQTSRGCPFNCEFCSVTTYLGTKLRFKSIDHVIEEIKNIPQKYIFFADDNFFGFSQNDMDRAEQLLKEIIRQNIDKYFFTQTSINISQHPNLLRLARKAGMFAIYIGIESFSQDVLTGTMNKRSNIKYVQNMYKKEIDIIHKEGIVIFGQLIYNHDEESPETILENIRLTAKSNIDGIGIAPLLAIPGTKLFDRIQSQDRLLDKLSPTFYARLFYDLTHTTNAIKDNHDLIRIREFIDRTIYSRSRIFKRFFSTLLSTGSLMGALSCLQQNIYMKKINLIMRERNLAQFEAS